MIQTITGTSEQIRKLQGKRPTFMLAMSNTATADIPGITQAGIPGMIHLTPILDGEFIATGEVRSLPSVAETPKGVPTPALITRAVHLLHPFARIELLDLGVRVQPQGDDLSIHHFGIPPSRSIAEGAGIDAKAVFEKGYAFGQHYTLKDDYLILAESVPSGTTTATATALALRYDAHACFSSSFKEVPDDIRQKTIAQALEHAADKSDLFEILGTVSDNMLIFNAGFILGVNGSFPIVLAGGTQMAAVLLVANRILQHQGQAQDLPLQHSYFLPPTSSLKELALCTTKWVAEDQHSNIKALLQMPDFSIDACYTDFDFSLAHHSALKLYDEGEAKEGVGAGGALMYGMLNGLSREEITRQVEGFLG